ncbi:methylenetetrahydrofolate reductase [NAD(P)H] [Schleiferilactobacillus perolens]|jgi:methylenetetrahydrofolate reductase (NADPH)|uniref:methylenetetrahydrofolate reductase [NAD(P)H] n=1 Tax=Schleiferilactobacillus perolens TaxID=100468 RepID=UPI0023523C98|nr:methylenetetrahydrofolate reductase [NAD(P)H] [Schleiferilactobacillus perolens]MCI2171169.1 methylenetetrahydrofolate reductase [NAD(P)H] [Schleiferilactobacillus perolens]
MKINQLFKEKTRPVISFEVFPPRKNATAASLKRMGETLDVLSGLHPDFVSVTFGANGTIQQTGTLATASYIRKTYGIETVAHLPAAQLAAPQIHQLLADLKDHGIENILALRGDIPASGRVSNDFPHACDLVRYIHECGDFNVLGACYPEGHPESPDLPTDIHYLKDKVNAGTSQLISQLFFDNQVFYDFVDQARAAGIQVPIEAGIMPVINQHQIERMATMSGVALPEKFTTMMAHFQDNPAAMCEAGIAYAVDQIIDLLVHGVDGIHLYTMDNADVAKRIFAATEQVLHA